MYSAKYLHRTQRRGSEPEGAWVFLGGFFGGRGELEIGGGVLGLGRKEGLFPKLSSKTKWEKRHGFFSLYSYIYG